MSSHTAERRGSLIVEVLIGIALFGFAAVVISNAIVNTIFSLNTLTTSYETEADIRFVRSQIVQIVEREELEDGGEIETLSSGSVEWEVEIEPTQVVDLFQLTMMLELEEPRPGIEPQQEFSLYVLRPTWSAADPDERADILVDAQDRFDERVRDRNWQ